MDREEKKKERSYLKGRWKRWPKWLKKKQKNKQKVKLKKFHT